jgi:hypothetical protein
MNWYKEIKLASIEYFYHGTGPQNLSTILSQGLNEEHNLLFDNPIKYRSIRSYGGIYLTNNIMTACSSGRKSARKEDGREAGPVDEWTLVGVKIENKTPHIVVDEDQFFDPSVVTDDFYNMRYSTNPYNIAHYITNSLENDIPSIIEKYLSFYKEAKGISNDKFLEGIKPYIGDLIRASFLRILANNTNFEEGTSGFDYYAQEEKERLERDFPQFIGLNEAEAENNYRNVANFVMQKANRLTEFTEKDWQTNVRSLESISFRGKNKIIMVCRVIENDFKNKYHTEFKIVYLTDMNIIEKMISDAQERFGQHFTVEYNNNILYDNPKEVKEKEYELV